MDDELIANELGLLEKTQATIRKEGSRWCIFSESGKNLGCYSNRKQALERLRQIEYFKSTKGDVLLGTFSTVEDKNNPRNIPLKYDGQTTAAEKTDLLTRNTIGRVE